MAKLALTVSPDYVRGWGLWEAIRELVQNAQDALGQGYDLKIWHRPKDFGGTLVLKNIGVTIDRQKLVLGSSDKGGVAGMRGKFGEGFKLAAVVLRRMGVELRIASGDEGWKFEVEPSDQFDGARLLTVHTSKRPYDNSVQVEVRGITAGEWDEIQTRILFMRAPNVERVAAVEGCGRVLFEDQYRGKLYHRGIYVGPMPDEFRFGYDLDNVELDRDRKLAEPWSLRWEITKLLNTGVQHKAINADLMMELLNSECGESKAIAANVEYGYTGSMGDAIAALFKEEYGDNAAPVESMGESVECEHHGLKGVVVRPALRRVLERSLGALESRKVSRATDAKTTFGVCDLMPAEWGNLQWAVAAVADRGGESWLNLDKVNVVEFHGVHVMGTFQGDAAVPVSLAKSILGDRVETLRVLVHEAAHNYGADATVEHRTATERILARIAVSFSR